MPRKNGPSFSLTFFVMFRHTDIIGSQAVPFNNKVAVANAKVSDKQAIYHKTEGRHGKRKTKARRKWALLQGPPVG